MKETICDGSGRVQYYKSRGETLLLCETVGIRHIHCECGNPVIGGVLGDRCMDCNTRTSGMSLHKQIGYIRETREHLDVTRNSARQRDGQDQNPSE